MYFTMNRDAYLLGKNENGRKEKNKQLGDHKIIFNRVIKCVGEIVTNSILKLFGIVNLFFFFVCFSVFFFGCVIWDCNKFM